MSAHAPARLDLEARRQLLLTRIAFERDELHRDIARLRQATSLPHLLRSIFGVRLKPDWFGADGTGRDGWIGTALSWLRRYRLATTLAATLFGGAAPLLRKRGRWRRLVLLTRRLLGLAQYAVGQSPFGLSLSKPFDKLRVNADRPTPQSAPRSPRSPPAPAASAG